MFVADVVLSNWVSKAEHARLKGFAGIRITGNPFWLRSHDERESFGRYERQVSERIKHQRILALCTYPMSTHTPSEMIDVMHLHSSALMPRMGAWRRVIASSLPRDRRGVAGPKSE